MKTMWIESMATAAMQATIVADAKAAGIDTLCIRTDSPILAGAIPQFHAQGLKVWGWRWPAVTPGPHQAPHWYALDEARYVTQVLMQAGLDGYVADIESDGPTAPSSNWDNAALVGLAQQFCDSITAARSNGVPTCAGAFAFGLTAGCRQPSNNRHIPWGVFGQAVDAVYPQAYWRMGTNAGPIAINQGTPDAAFRLANISWGAVAPGKPIRCIAGELNLITVAEIIAYSQAVAGQDQLHFYVHAEGLDPAKLVAINQL